MTFRLDVDGFQNHKRFQFATIEEVRKQWLTCKSEKYTNQDKFYGSTTHGWSTWELYSDEKLVKSGKF